MIKKISLLTIAFFVIAALSSAILNLPVNAQSADFLNITYLVTYKDGNAQRVHWGSVVDSQGEFRYATRQADLSSKNWISVGVNNENKGDTNTAVSDVLLNSLGSNATYYVEVRKSIQDNGSVTYGPSKIISFTMPSEGDYYQNAMTINHLALYHNNFSQVYWSAGVAGRGEYRYATSQSDLSGKSWVSSGVTNSGIISEVSLNSGSSGDYYIELRKCSIDGNGCGPTSLVVFTTIPVVGEAVDDGALFKSNSSPAIYLFSNGFRRLFANEKTFWSWYYGDWTNIITNDGKKLMTISSVSSDYLSSMSVGKNITVKPGHLIKFENSPRVYMVFHDNKLHLIDSDQLNYRFNTNWQDRVIVVQLAFEMDYQLDDQNIFVDKDNDGIDDQDEVSYYRTNPSKDDTDGDGYKDGSEIIGGYNPNGPGNLNLGQF